jgi:hypothetical protein
MNFGEAIEAMKKGAKCQRSGWNGKNMHVAVHTPHEHDKMDHPFIYMQTVDGSHIPWLASQADMLAEDWSALEAEG